MRARNIKPGFYKNEDLAECSAWARLIFPGLWMLADREGRLEDRPKRIKAELLPFDSQEIDPLLNELEARGFIHRYTVDGGNFIQITAFAVHQTPHYSEKDSVIKPPRLQESAADDDPVDSEKLSPSSPPDSKKDGASRRRDSKRTPENSGSDGLIKTGSQPPDSLIPDSLNHESVDAKASTPALRASDLVTEGIPDALARDFLAVRKAKKAPLTATAWAGVKREAVKAGWPLVEAVRKATESGWRGFDASWVAGQPVPGGDRLPPVAQAADKPEWMRDLR